MAVDTTAEVVRVRTIVLVTVLTLPPGSMVIDIEPSVAVPGAALLLDVEAVPPYVGCAEGEESGGGMSTIAILSRPTYALPTHVILNVAGAESSSYVAR
jgi:hypothetical protein